MYSSFSDMYLVLEHVCEDDWYEFVAEAFQSEPSVHAVQDNMGFLVDNDRILQHSVVEDFFSQERKVKRRALFMGLELINRQQGHFGSDVVDFLNSGRHIVRLSVAERGNLDFLRLVLHQLTCEILLVR